MSPYLVGAKDVQRRCRPSGRTPMDMGNTLGFADCYSF